ncbi:MAG: prepilin-type N-terminal cleavage/methylation domain-containing protein [Candidatus Berkelbacteria bacterium]|nr:prepilin-type N-terminal cleavage/methylation domain-containing protein [Candidatus Berkelbacteria bacterium]
MLKKSKSFTLIELMVVIFIIGILTTLIMVNLSEARARSRDARRKADVDSIRAALEMYYEVKGSYPGIANTIYESYRSCAPTNSDWDLTIIKTPLTPYISVMPKDPLHGKQMNYIDESGTKYTTSCGARYRYATTGTTYELNALMETDVDALKNDGGNSITWYEVGTDLTIMTN